MGLRKDMGVPAVVQHKDPALLQLRHRLQLELGVHPWPGNFHTPGAAIRKKERGVPVVAQWLTNLTRNHEVSGSVPALVQWVNDPALP